MDLFIGILMLAAFLAVVVLIIKGESPIITLLLLAIVWAVLARVPLMGEAGKDILSGVLEIGPLCLQGSQDPTNSWTLWTIGYTKITHRQFLQTALPWGWIMVAINAFLAYFLVPWS